jgi:hypothetical protein
MGWACGVGGRASARGTSLCSTVAFLARAVIPWRALLVAALLSLLIGAALSRDLVGGRSASLPTVPSHRGLTSLPLAAQGPVSGALGANRATYRVSTPAAGVALANNPAQRLQSRFERSGASISAGAIHVGLRLRSIGYGRSGAAVADVAPVVRANRVDYARAGLSEWYVNGPLGLEQGFTIARTPGVPHGDALTLAMTLSGNARASLSSDARGIVLSHGASALRYGGLIATDASGRMLGSRLGLDRGRLLIHVDTSRARYPLRIDPMIQQGAKLTGSGEEGPGNLGASVALSADGNTALIGGPGDEIKGKEMLVGAAWVFTRSGSTWTQQGPKLRGEDQEGEAQFGTSVALSADGDTALIGGVEDVTAKTQVGAAWVFTRAAGKWDQLGSKLTGVGEEVGSGRFGRSVALSADGNTALVGVYFDNGETGAAWVFKRSGSSYLQDGPKLTGEGEAGEAQFGFSVALSADGKTALIGGPHDEGVTKEFMAGAAWVFTESVKGWTQQGAKLTGGGEKGLGELGTSVALSADGETALIGAPGDGGAGGARAFTRAGASWSQQGPEIVPSDATTAAGFGAAVALAADGNTAMIGGPVDTPATTPVGAAWEFARVGASWSQQGATLQGGDTAPESEFGAATALSADGRTALIGGPIDGADVGAAWVFVNPPPILAPLPDTGASPPRTRPILAPPRLARPVLSKVTQTHIRWRAGSALARLSAKSGKRRAPLGTTISFTLNKAAKVTFTFTQRLGGRRVNGDCVAQSVKNRRKPSCKRTIVPGVQSFSGHAGVNKLFFQGALPRGKKLKPGTYTALIVASSGRLRSVAKTLSFTIVK